jgi:S1-C subfamily serine protease
MEAAEQQATCPRTFLIALFGADFANPHGCVIGRLTPDGLAAKAGLAVGDSIVSCNGTEVTCPSTLLPEVQQSFKSSEPGKVVLIIHRRLPAAGTK